MTPQSLDPDQSFRPGERVTGNSPSTAVSHQTVRLSKGRHASPAQDVCVMELASMLAGEPFSDNPAWVCPVIGSFLRMYNDAIGDDRRQDLYAYASKVVGSRASEAVERARAERLVDWATVRQRRVWTRLLALSPLRRLGLDPLPSFQSPGFQVVQAIRRGTDETHADALALIDELLALDPGQAAQSRAETGTVESEGATGNAVAGCGDRAARSDDERASLALLRERHKVT